MAGKLKWCLILMVSLVFLAACHAKTEADAASNDDVADESAAIESLAANANYLPLVRGRKWILRSKTSPATPIVLEVVEGSNERGARVKFDNPWLPSEFVMRADGDNKIYLTELIINNQTAQMPNDTLYFDLTAKQGATWSNQIGSFKILSRTKTVKAGNRNFTNCVQIQETNKEGNKLFWTFAPDVGFVQFGEDSWGFIIDTEASNLNASTSDANNRAALSANASNATLSNAASLSSNKVLIGLAATPTASEGFTPQSVAARFKQSVDAGVTFIYYAPKWNEIETAEGKYNFKDLDFHISEAEQAKIPLSLNLRTIDTNQRSMPKDLIGLKFSDAKTQARLIKLIEVVAPRLKNRATLIMIGNEVNSYFDSHADEISDYLQLYQAGARRTKELIPNAQTSVNFTFDLLANLNARYKSLLEASDFLSLTYYPANPDFTFRDPKNVAADFARMIQAAGGKKILLQEVGYASSPLNNSSEDKQAEFYTEVFEAVRRHRDVLLAVNFLFMSDLPDSVVGGFASYYNMKDAEKFKAFLKTLGMFNDNGKAKKSWEVFRTQAKTLT